MREIEDLIQKGKIPSFKQIKEFFKKKKPELEWDKEDYYRIANNLKILFKKERIYRAILLDLSEDIDFESPLGIFWTIEPELAFEFWRSGGSGEGATKRKQGLREGRRQKVVILEARINASDLNIYKLFYEGYYSIEEESEITLKKGQKLFIEKMRVCFIDKDDQYINFKSKECQEGILIQKEAFA